MNEKTIGFEIRNLIRDGLQTAIGRSCLVFASLLIATSLSWGQQPQSALEIFRDRCIECHSKRNNEGGLRLDHREGLLTGGQSGKVIELGRSDESLMIERVTATDETRMPPIGSPLSESQIDTLRAFINADAPWDPKLLRDPRLDHWAWKSLQQVNVPETPSESIDDSSPIDRFLSQARRAQGIKPVPMASKETLIRRLYFDVLGIPPTPEDVDDYLADTSTDAWERLVDRTLASPRYGERWARHWLDIAHYADTHGFERDQRRDHAWRYRDWVIDALNADLPYNKFIEDQIAGDVLSPADPQATIASSFLAAGPWDFVGQAETPSPVIKRLARADDLDDMVAQVMTSICGMTIHCARCHDHKLDPIPQDEYYSLVAIFSGVKRADRLVSDQESQRIEATRNQLKERKSKIDQELLRSSRGLLLADLVGGGNGFGTGVVGAGLDPNTGTAREPNDKKGFLEEVVSNRRNPTKNDWIESVFIPNGNSIASGIPATDSKAWDAIRNGPVNSQFSTSLDGIECSPPAHSMLSLHANAGITFRLSIEKLSQAFSKEVPKNSPLVFNAMVGYFGQTPSKGADVYVLLDGQMAYKAVGLGRDNGLQKIRLELPQKDSLLTLIATDGGNGIGHDQVCFVDALIAPREPKESREQTERIEMLRRESDSIQRELDQLPQPRRVYGVIAETPSQIHRLHRGNTEDARELVMPKTVSCVGPSHFESTPLDATSSDAQRRIALAKWLSSEDNPLPSRVIVNRLWHYHFGKGIVATPSDFGLGGAMPTHRELLDWLASELQRGNWSIKRMHRMILLSDAYRRTSIADENSGRTLDAGNAWLWRQNPRRLDAESLRDAMLAVSGSLDTTMHGPGYRDFDYQEEYAPVYQHRVLEVPEVFRRSVYRFVVRTTPHPFLTSLDCPNPATMTPVRNTTTTAIQSLATLNNAFVMQQSDRFAARLQQEAGTDPKTQAQRAIRLAFGRPPTDEEVASAVQLIESDGLFQLCRILFNTNEFIYVD
jgi:cytochrome c553